MLYKKLEIYEDNNLFENIKNMAELARLSGISESYLSLLKKNKRISSEAKYKAILQAKEKC